MRREKCPIHNLSRDRDRTPVIYLGLFIGRAMYLFIIQMEARRERKMTLMEKVELNI